MDYLNKLLCPITKTELIYDAANQQLISKAAGLAFPIKDGIPMLLESEAKPYKQENN